jgi:hypothetical protein
MTSDLYRINVLASQIACYRRVINSFIAEESQRECTQSATEESQLLFFSAAI